MVKNNLLDISKIHKTLQDSKILNSAQLSLNKRKSPYNSLCKILCGIASKNYTEKDGFRRKMKTEEVHIPTKKTKNRKKRINL